MSKDGASTFFCSCDASFFIKPLKFEDVVEDAFVANSQFREGPRLGKLSVGGVALYD